MDILAFGSAWSWQRKTLAIGTMRKGENLQDFKVAERLTWIVLLQ